MKRKLLSAACIAVLATTCFPANRFFANSAFAEAALQFLSNPAGGAGLPETIPYIGADPVLPGTSTQTIDPSGTAISLTEGNLIESQSVGGINDSTCSSCRSSQAACNNTHGISFTVTYNSRDADGSRARLDTVMGYGWTHSFNSFLFSQGGSMFRFGGDGRVTKYKVNADNSFTADTGYFETLVRKTPHTFVITQKDKTKSTFNLVGGAPFGMGGPVYRLSQIRDRNNDTVTLTYSGGNLVSVRDTYGRAMTLTYDADQNLAAVTDPLGRSTSFTYDATGTQLTTITDPLGKTIRYTYNSLDQLTKKVDKDGRIFSYSYTNNKPTGSTDGVGAPNFSQSNPSNWAIDPAALAADQLLVYLPSTTSKADGRGNLWRYEYDSRGYVTKITAPDGATTRYSYDGATRMVESVTDANNHTTRHGYDSQGNRTQIILAAPFNYVTSFTYEPVFNMMTSMTDPKGRVTSFLYDARGNRTTETDPLLQTRQWTYDTHGNVITETDKRGTITTYTYDAGGNRDTMIAPPPFGYINRMTYDSVGNLKTRTDPNGHTTKFDYDGLNRLLTEIDPAGNVTRSRYDGQGDRIQMTDRNDHSTLIRVRSAPGG